MSAGRGDRRGFALPMVVLLAMVGTIMTAVMLERQAAQQLSVDRQVVRYGVHHTGRGVKEVVGTWLNTIQNEPIDTLVGKDGHALDIELKDGRVVAIYLVEGQGTVLGDLSGLGGAKAAAAAGVLDRLRAAVSGERLPGFLRAAGPVAVSANTGSLEALAAAAGGILDASAAQSYAEFLIQERKDGKLPFGKLGEAANKAGVAPGDRTKLLELVTDKPSLYRLRAEIRGRDPRQQGQVLIVGGTTVLDRYSGLVWLEAKGSGRGAGSNSEDLMQPLRPFLTWEHDGSGETEGDE